MQATVLAIDAGNTRIKWGVHDGRTWLQQSAVDTVRALELRDAFRALTPSVVVVSNVAGARLRAELAALLAHLPAAHWIASRRLQCGVRNDYADPAQLGCDRWAALIGARARGMRSAVVVGAGTALTADALTADGVFLGGIIVPGERLMREALSANTAGLAQNAGQFSSFPRSTGDAIASGAINALCGAVERIAAFLERAGQLRPRCVLSGGGAALLAPHLNMEVELVDNLVLEGLIAIAHDTQSDRSLPSAN